MEYSHIQAVLTLAALDQFLLYHKMSQLEEHWRSLFLIRAYSQPFIFWSQTT